jgi:WD40 repeat protein
MKMFRIRSTFPLLFAAFAIGAAEPPPQPLAIAALQRATAVDFESDILPVFRTSCLACHNRTTTKGGLILETPQTILKGGEDGPVVVPGKSADSSLFQLAAHQSRPVMPPRDNKASAPNLTPQQLALLRLWIDQGARGEVHSESIRWQAIPASFAPAYAVALAPDGQYAATGRANQLHLYHLPTQRLLPPVADPRLQGIAHRDMIYSVAFSPDGTRLASGSFGEVKIWRRSPPMAKFSLPQGYLSANRAIAGGNGQLCSAPISTVTTSGGGLIAVAAGNGSTRIWNTTKNAMIAEVRGDPALARLAAEREADVKLATADVDFAKSILQKAEADQKAQQERARKATEASATAEKAAAEKQAALNAAADVRAQAEKALAAAQAQRKRLGDAAASADAAQAADAKASLAKFEPTIKPLTDKLAAATAAQAAAENALKPAQLARANAVNESELADAAVARATAAIATARESAAIADEHQAQATAKAALARQAAADAAAKPVLALAFSPDGLTLATADDRHIHFWNTTDGSAQQTIDTASAVQSLAFVNDTALRANAADHTTTLWDLSTAWMLERTIGSGDADSELADRVNALAFDPGGRVLATGSGEPSRGGQVKLWDFANGQLLRDFRDVHSDAVLCLAFSRDGRRLASGAADRFVKVLDANTGRVLQTLEGHTHHVLGVSFRADGRTLASGGADGQIKLWDLLAGERKANVPPVTKELTAVQFVGLTDQAFLASADHQIRVLNTAGAAVRTFSGPATDHIHAAALSPDGRTYVTAGQSGALYLWDANTAKLTATLMPPKPE